MKQNESKEPGHDGYETINPEGTQQSRRFGWETGFGLQQADGLTPSEYAYDVADRQTRGELTYDQAAKEINDYHAAEPDQAEHAEADIVAERISRILQEPVFAFSPGVLRMIHGRLFKGVLPMKWAGRWRTEDIRKSEPVLHGDSVLYSSWTWIEETLDYDFSQETLRRASYARTQRHDVAKSVFSFISGVWQIHPFREGNTRSTAVFTIMYLRSLGFELDNTPFAEHSQYFRDALVLANTSNSQLATKEPLFRFMDNLLFDANWPLSGLRTQSTESPIEPEAETPNITTTDTPSDDFNGPVL